jgi:hypothetical protein
MRTETIVYEVFKFNELSKEAQEKAHENYLKDIDYPFLEEYLNDYAMELLKENKIKIEGELKVMYDLSYSQGSGSQLNGLFRIGKRNIRIKQSGHYYYHERAIEYSEFNDEGEEYETNKHYDDFQNIFKQITKEGYNYIDNENSIETFKDLCEANEYEFLASGKRF